MRTNRPGPENPVGRADPGSRPRIVLLGLDRYAGICPSPGRRLRAVIIYTTAWCPYCAKLRTSLTASGIPYVEHDVEKSLQGQLGFWTLRGPASGIGDRREGHLRLRRGANRLRASGLGYSFIPVSDQKPANKPETGATSSAVGGSK